ncbi:MAG: hypothetical protein GY922_04465 [Proteobacteria bacterium]|nr:hypothetical protein [Pseudomonadota bacterium]
MTSVLGKRNVIELETTFKTPFDDKTEHSLKRLRNNELEYSKHMEVSDKYEKVLDKVYETTHTILEKFVEGKRFSNFERERIIENIDWTFHYDECTPIYTVIREVNEQIEYARIKFSLENAGIHADCVGIMATKLAEDAPGMTHTEYVAAFVEILEEYGWMSEYNN